VRVADAYSTGSSLMPQKRNPDSLELIRGKAGRVVGHLTGLLVTLKGLPSTYNKDLQEDKEPLFDAMDTLALTVPVAAGVLETLEVRPQRMAAALDDGMLATDLADYLAAKGMPFRQAHEVVGQAVRLAEERGVGLSRLSEADWAGLSHLIGPDVAAVFSHQRSADRRRALGGTGAEAVREQLVRARRALAEMDSPRQE